MFTISKDANNQLKTLNKMDLHDFLDIYFMLNFWISGVFIGGNLNGQTNGYTVFMAILLLFFGLLAFAAFLIDAIYKEFNNKDKTQ